MKVRTRIAPSPTGMAHVGTIYTALINFAFAKSQAGRFVLRIEDTDRERFVPGAQELIFNALQWLNIKYDEGPDIGGPFEPYVQSKRLDLYHQHAQELIKLNRAYYCFCTPERLAEMRKNQQKAGKPPMYDGTCRKIDNKEAEARAKKEKYVIRLKVPKSGTTSWEDVIRRNISFENKTIDDQVLIKSDGFPTYHLAVVVDDHLMQISHVIRAEEWISSTPKHILIYKSFNWKLPVFAHLPLLRNPDRSKLSKRRNPVSVSWYQENGFLAEALINYLALLGWSHPEEKEKFSLEEFISKFSLKRVKTTQPIFDLEKLRWLNGRYIRELRKDQLMKLLKPFIPDKADQEIVKKIIPLVHNRLHTLSEFKNYSHFFFETPKVDERQILKQSKHKPMETTKKLESIIKSFENLNSKNFSVKIIEQELKKLTDETWSNKKLFMCLRVVITGQEISPPLFETIEILGKKEIISRIKNAIKKLQ